MINLMDYDLSQFKQWLKENNEKQFRADQVFDWIYKDVWNFSLMKNIPSALREKLESNFYFGIPEIVDKYVSEKDGTTKFLYRFSDGNIIEAVVMKYEYGYSICVSTQVGCSMGCKFCASTIGGMIRNLTSGEILSEVLVAQKEIGERISNVVLMGSGEPLQNYDNVLKFIKIINSDYGLNIGQRHITLSTCGIVPDIIRLADEKLQITLAISLHAPNDVIRKSTMPVANLYSINDIMDACKYYINVTGKRITFEYALIKDVNDSSENAEELSKLLKGMLCHVNLIPVNEIKENKFRKSEKGKVEHFTSILKKNNIEATIRRKMGDDINAACGQLRKNYIESM